MALKKSTPLNLAALRQDYSMLPKIAAVKAQSSQQLFNAITSGLEKRKEKIEKKQLDDTARKMIEPLLKNAEFQKRFGSNVSVDEVLKLIGDPRKAIQLSENIIQATLAEEQLGRQIRQERLANKVRREQIRTSRANREIKVRETESSNLLNQGLQAVIAGKEIPKDILSSGKLLSDDLITLIQSKEDLTPEEVEAMKKGGFEILRNKKTGKVISTRILPNEDNPIAFEQQYLLTNKLLTKVRDLLEQDPLTPEAKSEAVRIFASIPGMRLADDEAPIFDEGGIEAIALHVGATLKGKAKPDSTPSPDEDDKNSSKTNFTTKSGVNVTLED